MLKRLLAGTAAALLAASVMAEARAEEVPEPEIVGLNWTVGKQSEGWAPFVVEGQCDVGTKEVRLDFSPADSVRLLEDQGSRDGNKLNLVMPLEVTAPWSTMASGTGEVNVVVTCLLEDSELGHRWEIVVDTATPTPGAPSVSATPSDGAFQPGGEIEVVVEGLAPNDDLTVDMYSTPVRIGTARTDATGRAVIKGRIPNDTTEGVHHIVVTDSTGQRVLFRFRVGPRIPAPQRPQPPAAPPTAEDRGGSQLANLQTGDRASNTRGDKGDGQTWPGGRNRHTGTRPGLPNTGS